MIAEEMKRDAGTASGEEAEGEPLPNPHPGETILEDFLKPWRMTPYRLAKLMRVPQTRLDQILKGRRAITADTALRLSRAIGCTPEFWLGLQAAYDLREALQQNREQYLAIQRYEHRGPLYLDGEEIPEEQDPSRQTLPVEETPPAGLVQV